MRYRSPTPLEVKIRAEALRELYHTDREMEKDLGMPSCYVSRLLRKAAPKVSDEILLALGFDLPCPFGGIEPAEIVELMYERFGTTYTIRKVSGIFQCSLEDMKNGRRLRYSMICAMYNAYVDAGDAPVPVKRQKRKPTQYAITEMLTAKWVTNKNTASYYDNR